MREEKPPPRQAYSPLPWARPDWMMWAVLALAAG